ncbi:MAG: hypothetical protein MUF50_02725 [Planctomycetes bacterium]|jgi:hypothetical protein|nr:hypothetical protein [Planctomycetota bacterium]
MNTEEKIEICLLHNEAIKNKVRNTLHLISDEAREKTIIDLMVLDEFEKELREKLRLFKIFKNKPEVFKFHLNMKKPENKN